jgi:hypothetical protein
MELRAADERRHTADGDPAWTETWVFDFATPDARLGGRVLLAVPAGGPTARYAAYVVGHGRQPVAVLDDTVPLPRNGGLELRTEGLWADHIVEEPFEHISVGCEAFALEVEAGETVTMDARGDRVPFGLDLGWETAGPVRELPTGPGYAIPCDVVGLVLLGAEAIELDGIGWRRHRWGLPAPDSVEPGWSWGRTDDGRWLADDDPGPVSDLPVPLPRITLGSPSADLSAPGSLTRFRDPRTDVTGTGWRQR